MRCERALLVWACSWSSSDLHGNEHASLLTLFLWLHISMTFLVVVSRSVGYDTLFVTRNRKFRMLYFDRDLNACLSVSDEWFVFKVWQRKMISCCSTISISIAYISGACLWLEKLCPVETVGFDKNKERWRECIICVLELAMGRMSFRLTRGLYVSFWGSLSYSIFLSLAWLKTKCQTIYCLMKIVNGFSRI